MGTHAYIGKINKDDLSIKLVYVQYNGGLNYTGQMLNTHYQSEDKIDTLIEKGSFPSLKENINDIDFYTNIKSVVPEIYTFQSTKELEQFLTNHSDIEYVYMYDSAKLNTWLVSDFMDDVEMLDWQLLQLMI